MRVAKIWKRGGGLFERVRKVQMTMTWIFIVLESESHGLSENWDGVSWKARKFNRFFSPKTGDLQKKRSSPKLRLIFRLKSEIQTLFQVESRLVLHNFGTQFPLGEAVFNFLPKIGLKSTKYVRFCILYKPMGRLEPPPALHWLRYWFGPINKKIVHFEHLTAEMESRTQGSRPRPRTQKKCEACA